MRGNEELPAELKAFEAELAALVPEDERLDRARLLFAAGRASARRGARRWAAAFGTMSVAAAALLMALILQTEPPVKIVERIVHVPAVDGATPSQQNVGVAGPDARVVGPSTRVAGPKRSAGPGRHALAGADRDNLATRPLRYGTPERTSVLAAVFFGVPDELGSPIRRASDHWRVGDWRLSDDPVPASQPTHDRQPGQSPPPQETKTYRQLFEELTKTHG